MVRKIGFATSLFLSVAVGALGACTDSPTEEPQDRVDLRAALGVAAVDPIAVTITPDGSERFVFDRFSGIHQLDANGGATLLMSIDDFPDPGVEVRLPYTDLVALGDGKFALTAIGDGFLLDTVENTMALHFCYEPDFLPEEFVQRTDAVTYDRDLDKIIAQPQTFNELDEVVSSDIGYYDRLSGFDETWFPLNINFAAGGMAVASNGDLFLGEGTMLYRYDKTQNATVAIDNLSRFGLGSVDGLSFDHNTGDLLAVDGAREALVTIGADQLAP